jgi:hypothetical protein
VAGYAAPLRACARLRALQQGSFLRNCHVLLVEQLRRFSVSLYFLATASE